MVYKAAIHRIQWNPWVSRHRAPRDRRCRQFICPLWEREGQCNSPFCGPALCIEWPFPFWTSHESCLWCEDWSQTHPRRPVGPLAILLVTFAATIHVKLDRAPVLLSAATNVSWQWTLHTFFRLMRCSLKNWLSCGMVTFIEKSSQI